MNRVLMKLFKTSNIEIIEECRRFFQVELPAVQLQKRFLKFFYRGCIYDSMNGYLK